MAAYIRLTGIFLVSLFFTACQHSAEKSSTTTKEYTPEQFTRLWDRTNILRKIDTLKMLYADTVLFYGARMSRDRCIAAKEKFFKQHPDFRQEICKYMGDEKSPHNERKCFFIKKTTLDHKEKEYSSYLNFRQTDAGWQIVTEGDVTTDQNIKVLARTGPDDILANAIEGDYDGDGKKDYAWVLAPQTDTSGLGGCDDGRCECFIKFSDPKIPFIKIEQEAIGGALTNHGDINGDGADELGFLPDWFSSCWRDYYVYTLRDRKWRNAVEPFTTYCSYWDSTVSYIRPDPGRKGYAIIRYTPMAIDSDFRFLSKSVPLR